MSFWPIITCSWEAEERSTELWFSWQVLQRWAGSQVRCLWDSFGVWEQWSLALTKMVQINRYFCACACVCGSAYTIDLSGVRNFVASLQPSAPLANIPFLNPSYYVKPMFLGLILISWQICFALHYWKLDTCGVEALQVTSSTGRQPSLTGCPPDCTSQHKVCLFSITSILLLVFSLWSATGSQSLCWLFLVPHLMCELQLILTSTFFPSECSPDCFKLFPEFVEIIPIWTLLSGVLAFPLFSVWSINNICAISEEIK